MPTVITSFNWAGYQRYGKKFIESWLEFWPKTIRLIVYYEGKEFEDFEFPTGVSWRPIEEVEFLADFMETVNRFPITQGIVGDHYDINFDARMGRKTFMQVHTARRLGGKVFWMDADSLTYKHVPEAFLDSCLPDDKFCCYLGRDGWYFTESGFIGFNAEHPMAKKFFRDYVHLFISGVFLTLAPQFNQERQYVGGGWHDCIAFDTIRFVRISEGHGGEFVNMSRHVPTGTMHPMANSAIGKYVHHLKGARKDTGRLKEGDVVLDVEKL